MVPTLALCRAQENLNRLKAEGTTLENVRRVANDAADAWAKEAVAAERREERHVKVRGFTEAAGACRVDENGMASENPDRGFADGRARA